MAPRVRRSPYLQDVIAQDTNYVTNRAKAVVTFGEHGFYEYVIKRTNHARVGFRASRRLESFDKLHQRLQDAIATMVKYQCMIRKGEEFLATVTIEIDSLPSTDVALQREEKVIVYNALVLEVSALRSELEIELLSEAHHELMRT